MSPLFKVRHVWAIATVARVKHHLVIVETVGQNGRDIVGCSTSSDILAVPASTGRPKLRQYIYQK